MAYRLKLFNGGPDELRAIGTVLIPDSCMMPLKLGYPVRVAEPVEAGPIPLGQMATEESYTVKWVVYSPVFERVHGVPHLAGVSVSDRSPEPVVKNHWDLYFVSSEYGRV